MEYNVMNQIASPALAQATRAGIGVLARVPLGRGFLSGRFDVSHQFWDGNNRRRNFATETMQKFAGKLEHEKREANSLGISPAALATRFCVSNKHVSCVIPGIRTVDRARDNAAACEPLPNDVMQRLLVA